MAEALDALVVAPNGDTRVNVINARDHLRQAHQFLRLEHDHQSGAL
jgi:hypothetical protein